MTVVVRYFKKLLKIWDDQICSIFGTWQNAIHDRKCFHHHPVFFSFREERKFKREVFSILNNTLFKVYANLTKHGVEHLNMKPFFQLCAFDVVCHSLSEFLIFRDGNENIKWLCQQFFCAVVVATRVKT